MRRRYQPGPFTLEVRRSSIGRGLFTASEIPRGACIIEYTGRTLSRDEEYSSRSKYLFAVHARKTIDGKPRDNLAGYINHACRPNAEPVVHKARVFIFARRAIQAGEELTYDYGKAYTSQYCDPCRCASCTSKQRPRTAKGRFRR